MPLQSVLVEQAFKKMRNHQVEGLLSPPCGQGIGMMIEQTDVRNIFLEMLTEFGDTMENMSRMYDERN